ncbi:MAG: hypothetical protein WDN04_13460 [Rhodospirillales bacterium]
MTAGETAASARNFAAGARRIVQPLQGNPAREEHRVRRLLGRCLRVVRQKPGARRVTCRQQQARQPFAFGVEGSAPVRRRLRLRRGDSRAPQRERARGVVLAAQIARLFQQQNGIAPQGRRHGGQNIQRARILPPQRQPGRAQRPVIRIEPRLLAIGGGLISPGQRVEAPLLVLRADGAGPGGEKRCLQRRIGDTGNPGLARVILRLRGAAGALLRVRAT